MRKLAASACTRTRLTVIVLFCQFFLAFSNANSQVYNGNITLNTQADVDAFNYTSVTGIVFISNISSNINNLDHLSTLTSIGQNLLISRQNDLTNIDGLSNLQTVAGIVSITDCPKLLNIDGLFGLQSCDRLEIGGQFSGNERLKNIDGLHNLISCHSIKINKNDSLENIDPLVNFSVFTGDLIIDENPMLTNIDGLANLTHVGGDFTISGSGLTNLNALSKLATISGGLTVKGFNLTDISGLSNLTFIESLSISAKESDLNAFSKLTQIHFLIIDQNPNLTSLAGLSKITDIQGSLFLESNSILNDLTGLSNITHIDFHLFINSNSHLTNLDGLTKLLFVGRDLEIHDNSILTDFCGLSNLFNSGSIGGEIKIFRNGANTVSITPPPDIILNNDPGLCSRDISAVVPAAATVTGCLNPAAPSSSPYPAGNVFPVGTTNIVWSVYDGAGSSATAVQHVTIVDNEPPVITNPPANITVSCAADVPVVDVNSIATTDNCPNVVVTHVGDVITLQACTNKYRLTRTYLATDHWGNTTACSQVITVNDDVPPQITGLNTSQVSLWPANHTMRDITVNYTVSDNCVTNPIYSINITSSEPVNGVADGDTDPDWEIIDDHHIRLRAERAANGTGRIYTITITVNDGCNDPVTATTFVHVAHNITGPHSGNPFRVGSTVNFTGEFWDRPTNKHSAKWQIDNSSVKGTVTEPTTNKNGKVTGSYKFTAPGVYKLQMNVTDQTGVTSYSNTNGDLEEIVVIYDPNGGYVYGGGWFASQPGALISDPNAEGKASYGFTVNYFKSSTYPKGETQFEFKVGSLEFNALNFEYLVINGATAQFRGTGKITGDQSGYAFIMIVIDGDLDGSGVDKIRMKIYNKTNGRVVYDNLPGGSDAADPVAAVGDNSSVVIYSTNNLITTSAEQKENTETLMQLQVNANPNPSSNNFLIKVQSNEQGQVKIEVVDLYGRVIEVRSLHPNTTISLGENYKAGVYLVKLLQGRDQTQLKLVKF